MTDQVTISPGKKYQNDGKVQIYSCFYFHQSKFWLENYKSNIWYNSFILIKLKHAIRPLISNMILNMHNHFIIYLLIASYHVLLFFLYPIDNPTLTQQLDFSLHLQLLMTCIFTHYYDTFKYLLLVTVTCISKSYHFLMKCNS